MQPCQRKPTAVAVTAAALLAMATAAAAVTSPRLTAAPPAALASQRGDWQVSCSLHVAGLANAYSVAVPCSVAEFGRQAHDTGHDVPWTRVRRTSWSVPRTRVDNLGYGCDDVRGRNSAPHTLTDGCHGRAAHSMVHRGVCSFATKAAQVQHSHSADTVSATPVASELLLVIDSVTDTAVTTAGTLPLTMGCGPGERHTCEGLNRVVSVLVQDVGGPERSLQSVLALDVWAHVSFTIEAVHDSVTPTCDDSTAARDAEEADSERMHRELYNPRRLTSLLHQARKDCEWSTADLHEEMLQRALVEAPSARSCATVNPTLGVSSEAAHASCLMHAAAYANESPCDLLDSMKAPPPRPRRAGALRLGIVATTLRDHAVGHTLAGAFEVLASMSHVEVFCYTSRRHNETSLDSSMRARLSRGCSFARLYDVGASDAASLSRASCAVAAQLMQDRPDATIDLDGWTRGSLMPALLHARAISPKSDRATISPSAAHLHFLGHPARMLSTDGGVDWVALDTSLWAVETEPAVRRRLTQAVGSQRGQWPGHERLLLLPSSYYLGDHTTLAQRRKAWAAAEEGPPSHTREGRGLRLCSWNRPSKLDARTLLMWCNMLRRHPTATLMMTAGTDDDSRSNLLQSVASMGVSPRRISFADRVNSREAHLLRMSRECDLALDTPMFNAGSVGVDALFGATPLLTLPRGHTVASRMAASTVRAAGTTELVCFSSKAYEDTGGELSDRRAVLSGLQSRMRRVIDAAAAAAVSEDKESNEEARVAPLYDTVGRTRALVSAAAAASEVRREFAIAALQANAKLPHIVATSSYLHR